MCIIICVELLRAVYFKCLLDIFTDDKLRECTIIQIIPIKMSLLKKSLNLKKRKKLFEWTSILYCLHLALLGDDFAYQGCPRSLEFRRETTVISIFSTMIENKFCNSAPHILSVARELSSSWLLPNHWARHEDETYI